MAHIVKTSHDLGRYVLFVANMDEKNIKQGHTRNICAKLYGNPASCFMQEDEN